MLIRPRRRQPLPLVLGLALCWAALVGLVLLWLYPARPTTAVGWGLLIALGPVVWLGVDQLGVLVGSKLEPAGLSPARFSWRRVLSAVPALLVAGAIAAAAFWALQRLVT